MGVIMFAINPVVGAINDALNNALLSMNGASKIVLGLVLGGMMSVDMGGPVNKAAYVFVLPNWPQGSMASWRRSWRAAW